MVSIVIIQDARWLLLQGLTEWEQVDEQGPGHHGGMLSFTGLETWSR